MKAIELILSTALGFGFLFLVFRPLEYYFPAKPNQRFFRPAWLTDLCFFLGQYLPVFILGFGLEPLAALVAFRGIWAIYIHSNVRLPIGPLRMLIGAPELHHWHHDRNRQAGNYANISPLMDLIFGTYRCPDQEPESFGIDEPIARSYLGQMLHPFLPSKKAPPVKVDW